MIPIITGPLTGNPLRVRFIPRRRLGRWESLVRYYRGWWQK